MRLQLISLGLLTSAVLLLPVRQAFAQQDVAGLIRALNSGDAKARQSAAQQLAIAAPSERVCGASSSFMDRLSDSVPEVRTWVAGILLQCVISNSSSAPPVAQQQAALLSGLSDPNPTVRLMMLRLVAVLQDPIPAQFQSRVIEMLRDPDRKVRQVAIASMSRMKPLPADVVSTLDSLIERKDEDRAAAVTALGELKITDPRTIDLLNGALQENDRYLRQEAIRAVTAIGHPAVAAIPALHALASDPKADVGLKKLAEHAIEAIQ